MLKLLILLTFAVVFCGKKSTPPPPEIFVVSGVEFKMIGVAAGSFLMGAQANDPSAANYDSDAESNEGPVHNVTLTKDYYIGEAQVTQELWEVVMGSNPSWFQSSTDAVYSDCGNCPVEQVSWDDIVGTSASAAGYTVNNVTYYQNGFCYKLSQRLSGGKKFRLPTEAEWEYVARGGEIFNCPCLNGNRVSSGDAASKQTKYSGSDNIDDVAWYIGTVSHGTEEVKTKQANALGIYDMSGNVEEWCSDFANSESYSGSDELDPTGPVNGYNRMSRGGSCRDIAEHCRVSSRLGNGPAIRSAWIGLRLALSSE